MKKISSIFILILFFILNVEAQSLTKEERFEKFKSSKEYENSIHLGQTGRNELNINLLSPLWGSVELNYERFLNENSTYGIAGNLGISNDYYSFSSLLAYYRVYFGRKINNGFFIEANSGFSSIKEKNYDYYYSNSIYYQSQSSVDRYNGLGVGVAIGYKLLAKNGVVCQIFGGLGRNFGNLKDDYSPVFPRAGITIGRRFGK